MVKKDLKPPGQFSKTSIPTNAIWFIKLEKQFKQKLFEWFQKSLACVNPVFYKSNISWYCRVLWGLPVLVNSFFIVVLWTVNHCKLGPWWILGR